MPLRFFLVVLIILLAMSVPVDSQAVDNLGGMSRINPIFTGDFDGMVARRAIRVLVTYSKTFYFLDGGQQRGLSYELIKSFEKHVNRKQKKAPLKVNVFIIPVARDRLIPALLEGRGDIAIANLTITAPRQKKVDFSDPFLTDVREIFITGPQTSTFKALGDTAGLEVHVRRSSSYYESLLNLQDELKAAGLDSLRLREADEHLEDEDLLEMLNAGLIPAMVMDSHKAAFWQQIFKDIQLHTDLSLRQDGRIGWAFRKNSPLLQQEINTFARQHRKGTLMGNILFKRYLQNTNWARNALAKEDMARFDSVVDLFKNYASRYDFDYLMIMAQAYQESGLDQSKVSPAGAVGIMQLLPSTATSKPVGIKDIHKLENNIHAGVKYLRHVRNTYFSDDAIDPLNQTLFTFAAYNAGPSRIMRLRREAARQGLNPNRWFHNVENIVAREIGRETVHYVGHIFKYYIAYRLAAEKMERKKTILKDKQTS